MREIIFIANTSFWVVMCVMAYIDRTTISTSATRFIIGMTVLSFGVLLIASGKSKRQKLKEQSTLRKPNLCFWPPNPEDTAIPTPKLDLAVWQTNTRPTTEFKSLNTVVSLRGWLRRKALYTSET
jgi:hypothetical protein